MTQLTPFALVDTPALIEAVFPAQKISFEAQRERTAGPAQTLTALGAYWKGRKPLILVRSIILGALLPQTDNNEKDLEMFEMLMAFDEESLAKRSLMQNSIKPKDIAKKVSLHNPWDFFRHDVKVSDERFSKIDIITFPFDTDALGIKVLWRKDATEKDKIHLLTLTLKLMNGYEEKSLSGKRPEEIDQQWLYEHIWPTINHYYAAYGINASSHRELIEQLGLLRYGRRPRVGDSFAGGGSIPYEAARLGCDAFASDLNPIACMLAWGAKNIIGADNEEQVAISATQDSIIESVGKEISKLGIEENSKGDVARMFLYCLEVICPETGWSVPLLPTLVVSTRSNCIAKLRQNHQEKRFEIEIVEGVTNQEVLNSKKGTIQDGALTYKFEGKMYRIPIKTLRGDYRDSEGLPSNRLRTWGKTDFKSAPDDIYQERLYAIQWIRKGSLNHSREETYFSSVTFEDLERENRVEGIVSENIENWQQLGLIPDMEIEAGYNTSQPVRERGWTHWHHLFSPRQLLVNSMVLRRSLSPESTLLFPRILDFNSKLTTWVGPSNRDKNNNTFSQQKLSPLFNRAERGWCFLRDTIRYSPKKIDSSANCLNVENVESSRINTNSDLWITDPPYADAVNYHEITEFFIAWLRKNPPKPFDEWTWDSRRALAIKGTGDDFRKGMVGAYKAMTDHMPDNGMQCVMFTHQDTGVWSDMVGIFWAAGLQVVGAWYIATETSTELKKGGYVQGTIILMLRKRPAGENSGFKQRLLPAVRAEVKHQIETMMHLNVEVKDKMGEPVFNDSDLQMAGYAAALKVLTAYTHIGGEDVTTFALKPRTKGEVTVVDEIVQQAAEAANSLLVPEGLSADTWQKLSGIQRFYLRMMDIETTGAAKLDNYQNFAKAFRVEDYARVMGSMAANKAQLKRIPEFASRDLTESNEIGSTWLGHLIIGLQQLLAETDPQAVISQLQADLPDFMEIRALLIDVLTFIKNKAPEKATRDVAEVLCARLRNMRAIG
jgi:putative DNA methylase